MKCFSMNALAAFGLAAVLTGLAPAQTATKARSQDSDTRASAYYNFSMGHLYAELAATYGNRGDYVDRAIEHYKLALKADPGAAVISEELTDLYIQSGHYRDAVTEAEDMLRRDPENIDARRILGRIYSRMIGDAQQNRVNEDMLRKATEQYQKVVEKEPKDADAWLMLGRLYKFAQNSVEAQKAYNKALALDPNNEYALSGLAIAYADVGDTRNAVEMWRRLAEQSPSPQTLRALANGYEQQKDYASAVEALRRAQELAPKDAEVKRDLAEDLALTNKTAEALKLYTELAATDPKDARTQLRLSQLYRQERNFPKARDAQEKAKALDPNSIEIRYNEINILDAEGKTPEAIDRLKEIINSTAKKTYAPPEKANRVLLLERLGVLCRAAEQYPQAVDTFEQIARLDPDSRPRVLAQVIDTYRLAKDFAKAEREADAAVKQFPNDRAVRLTRASLLADIGKTQQAAEDVKRLFNGQNDRENWLSLAQIYDKGRNFTEMAKALDAAEKLSTGDEEKGTVFFMRGAMLEKMKKNDEAETEFRKVLAIDPNNPSALNYLGYMLADRNLRLQEAQQLISRALELDPNNGAYLDSLGWVYFRMGKFDQAEAALRRALEQISNDPTVHDHLGDTYLQQGKLKEAIAQWQASVKQWEASSQADQDPAEIAKIHKKLENAKVRLAKESGGSAAQPR
jgi:tetratricopeptide (TPR) repeat protein